MNLAELEHLEIITTHRKRNIENVIKIWQFYDEHPLLGYRLISRILEPEMNLSPNTILRILMRKRPEYAK